MRCAAGWRAAAGITDPKVSSTKRAPWAPSCGSRSSARAITAEAVTPAALCPTTTISSLRAARAAATIRAA